MMELLIIYGAIESRNFPTLQLSVSEKL